MIIFFIIPVIAVFYVLMQYNRFVTLKTRIKASIQEIGNQLKRQYSLIPNLAAGFKGAAKQEKEVYKMLTEARKTIVEAIKSGNEKSIDASQEFLQKALEQVKITVENNPQMMAIGTITSVMENVRDTADKLMYARRTLIDLSADYNVMLATFPGNLVGKLFGFKEAEGLKTPLAGEFLEVSEEETKTPELDLEK